MTESDGDLNEFVGMLPRLLASHFSTEEPLGGSARTASLRRALDEADVANLALETLELPDSRRWLTATVASVAGVSPSLAYVLAARYTAQRALAAADPGSPRTEATTGVVTSQVGDAVGEPFAGVLIPDLFGPESFVLVDPTGPRGVAACRTEVTFRADAPGRTGLTEAQLTTVSGVGSAESDLGFATTAAAITDWTLFTAAVSFGIAQRACLVAQDYAADRRQFGSSLLAFPALRAMIAEMQLRVSAMQAMLDRACVSDAVGAGAGAAELSAVAGRAAVDIALDAIQIHGGYGYIDEYPVAGLLRDALSMRARSGSRRSAVAVIAAHHVGLPE